jgi:hypothetical protein
MREEEGGNSSEVNCKGILLLVLMKHQILDQPSLVYYKVEHIK